MIIMGIDSSTTSTGWAIIDTKLSGNSRLMAHGTIKPNSKLKTTNRIIHIGKELKEIIRSWEPEFIVIEEINVFRNAKSTRGLVGLIVYIEIILELRQALYTVLTPSQWRKLVGIKGARRDELKQASIEFVKNKYAEAVNDDEGDAICIAEAGSKLEVES